MRRRPAATCIRTHSAPARVLPKPRPARINQRRHSPSGGFCPVRPQVCQSYSAARLSGTLSVLIVSIGSRLTGLGEEGGELFADSFGGLGGFGRVNGIALPPLTLAQVEPA
jgi:hypothetical protein